MRESVIDCIEYSAGSTPLLISIPHDGRKLPPAIAKRLTRRAAELPDTDWHVRRLYEFARDFGAAIIAANYSRYVVDLNRSHADESLYDGRFVTGLCPAKMFDGNDIYLTGEAVSADEQSDRIERYWRPYHDKIVVALSDIRNNFGYALLWDAHSIPSRVPLLFEGELPIFNFGTNEGRSCAIDLIDAVVESARTDGSYSIALDGRFKGGYITRRYGDPGNGVHAIQLELAQRSYMDEGSRRFDDELAAQLQQVLANLLRVYMTSAALHYEGGE